MFSFKGRGTDRITPEFVIPPAEGWSAISHRAAARLRSGRTS